MVFPEAVVGSSVTTNVLPALRDVTLVWTLGLSNSVIWVFGISSVNVRSSSAEGLSWIFFASTVTSSLLIRSGTRNSAQGAQMFEFYPEAPQGNRAPVPLPGAFDLEVQANLGPVLDDLSLLDPIRRAENLEAVDVADRLAGLPDTLSGGVA